MKIVDKIMMVVKKPSFKELMTFIEESHGIAWTLYGTLAQCNFKIEKSSYEGTVDKTAHWIQTEVKRIDLREICYTLVTKTKMLHTLRKLL